MPSYSYGYFQKFEKETTNVDLEERARLARNMSQKNKDAILKEAALKADLSILRVILNIGGNPEQSSMENVNGRERQVNLIESVLRNFLYDPNQDRSHDQRNRITQTVIILNLSGVPFDQHAQDGSWAIAYALAHPDDRSYLIQDIIAGSYLEDYNDPELRGTATPFDAVVQYFEHTKPESAKAFKQILQDYEGSLRKKLRDATKDSGQDMKHVSSVMPRPQGPQNNKK